MRGAPAGLPGCGPTASYYVKIVLYNTYISGEDAPLGEIVWDVIPEGLSGGCQPQKNQTPAGSGASKCHRQGKSVTDAAASLLSISSTAPNAHINNMVNQDAVVLMGAHQRERRAAAQIHDKFPS